MLKSEIQFLIKPIVSLLNIKDIIRWINTVILARRYEFLANFLLVFYAKKKMYTNILDALKKKLCF